MGQILHQTIIIVVILIFAFFGWGWYMLANPPVMLYQKFQDTRFKSGDMILFHAYNNINPVFIGSYWGHVGIVWQDPDIPNAPPMLFEAAYVGNERNCTDYNKNGIIISDLYTRLSKYPGLIALKRLHNELQPDIIRGFASFMSYAKTNMYYNDRVIYNGMQKFIGEKLNTNTNCGEITVLSLIKFGLISIDILKQNIAHHLLYVVGLKTLQNNYYHDLVEIGIDPF